MWRYNWKLVHGLNFKRIIYSAAKAAGTVPYRLL
jgi:hypothetical protein